MADMFKLVAWFVTVLRSSKPCPTGTTPSDAELTTAATLAFPLPGSFLELHVSLLIGQWGGHVGARLSGNALFHFVFVSVLPFY